HGLSAGGTVQHHRCDHGAVRTSERAGPRHAPYRPGPASQQTAAQCKCNPLQKKRVPFLKMRSTCGWWLVGSKRMKNILVKRMIFLVAIHCDSSCIFNLKMG